MRSLRHFRMGFGIAAVVAVVLAGQAFGQSKLTYTLEVGGDNGAAVWKAGTLPRPLYARGNAADGQALFVDATHPLNYAVVLKAEGVQNSGNGSGFTIFGAANVVFNVEIYVGGAGSTTLATGAVFKSTINDGTSGDPQAAAAFATSYNIGGQHGRLIDKVTSGGPRLEPIFTYPFFGPNSGKLIGMGAGYKEWNHNSADVYTKPGVGMGPVGSDNPMPDGASGFTDGLGVVPIAEGQIDLSALPVGTYTLKVVPGLGNNVLRGDENMLASSNWPAFATAANQTAGDTITFVTTNVPPCTGVTGRYVFYNNSAWDGNTPGIVTPGDYAAIATDKTPLLPGGGLSSFANYISYSKRINGIMVDACHFNRLPIVNQDLIVVMGNTTGDPLLWQDTPAVDPTMALRPGEGVGGSDRLIMTWPDGTIPNTTWILVALFADDPTLGLPATDMFIFGIGVGESTGNYVVDASDELAARSHPRTVVNPAPITDPYDFNRDKKVDATDQLISRSNRTTVLTKLKQISW